MPAIRPFTLIDVLDAGQVGEELRERLAGPGERGQRRGGSRDLVVEAGCPGRPLDLRAQALGVFGTRVREERLKSRRGRCLRLLGLRQCSLALLAHPSQVAAGTFALQGVREPIGQQGRRPGQVSLIELALRQQWRQRLHLLDVGRVIGSQGLGTHFQGPERSDRGLGRRDRLHDARCGLAVIGAVQVVLLQPVLPRRARLRSLLGALLQHDSELVTSLLLRLGSAAQLRSRARGVRRGERRSHGRSRVADRTPRGPPARAPSAGRRPWPRSRVHPPTAPPRGRRPRHAPVDPRLARGCGVPRRDRRSSGPRR